MDWNYQEVGRKRAGGIVMRNGKQSSEKEGLKSVTLVVFTLASESETVVGTGVVECAGKASNRSKPQLSTNHQPGRRWSGGA